MTQSHATSPEEDLSIYRRFLRVILTTLKPYTRSVPIWAATIRSDNEMRFWSSTKVGRFWQDTKDYKGPGHPYWYLFKFTFITAICPTLLLWSPVLIALAVTFHYIF